MGWQGRDIAISGRNEGNAGIIFNTGIENDGLLTARVDGRMVKLSGNKNYLPLSPYGQYDVELMNNKNSAESFDIVTVRKSKLTLYPGNVAVISPEIKQMVTVFGRIKAEDGTLLANAYIRTISAAPAPMRKANLSWMSTRNSRLSILPTAAIRHARWI